MEFYGFSATQAQEAVEIYRGRYEKIGVRENAPYPGVHECLQRLRERGYTLMLATSKPENTARTVLKEFELEGFFDFVCGRDAEGRLHSKDAGRAYSLPARMSRSHWYQPSRPEPSRQETSNTASSLLRRVAKSRARSRSKST